MAAASSDGCFDVVIVWEWENEHGKWCPYTPKICHLLEVNKGLSTVDIAISVSNNQLISIQYTVNLTRYVQTRKSTGVERKVRRREFTGEHIICKGIGWQWQGDKPLHNWSYYAIDIGEAIEAAFLAGMSSYDLSQLNPSQRHTVDLNRNIQINKKTLFERKIRRFSADVKYPKERKKNSSRGSQKSPPSFPLGQNFTVETTSNNNVPLVQPGSSSSSSSVGGSPDGGNHSNSPTAASNSNTPSRQNSVKTATAQVTPAGFTEPPTGGWNSTLPTQHSVPSYKTSVTVGGGAAPEGGVATGGPVPGVSSASANLPPIDGGLVLAPACNVKTRPHPTIYLPQQFTVGPKIAHGVARVAGNIVSCLIPVTIYPPPIPMFLPPETPKRQCRSVEGVQLPERCKGKTKEHPFNEVSQKHMSIVNSPDDEACTICFLTLSGVSGFNDNCSDCVKLKKCGHFFHRACTEAMYKSSTMDGSLVCPKCKTIHGVKTGNQPAGTMDFIANPHSLPGCPDCGSIRISYNVEEGIQSKEHQNPGSKFTARGFPRVCYLPDNDQGKRVLKLLKVAWDRRLIFTIGHSSTTAEDNTVIWNDIHHKTEFGSNTRGHGYPDPFYLDNVLSELATHGITDESLQQ